VCSHLLPASDFAQAVHSVSLPPCYSLEGALAVPHGAAYLEVTGSLLFGAGELLEEALEDMSRIEPVQVGGGRGGRGAPLREEDPSPGQPSGGERLVIDQEVDCFAMMTTPAF